MTQTTAGGLVRALLDRGYEQATRQTLRAIGTSVNSGLITQRLAELDTETARLIALGQNLKPDNPVIRALLADLDTEMRRNATRLDAGAADAQRTGIDAAARLVRELALPGINDRQLAAIGMQWNTPDPDAVNALVGYVNSDGWKEELARYPGVVNETVQNQAIRGLVEGWNPLKTAAEIRRVAQSLPIAQANTLMRTVQLQSYRDAAVMQRMANADILTEQIRIAVLDQRTCMACVALHGTRLPIDQRIVDHHNGRCTSISVVRGRPRDVPTGETWFNGLTEEQQRAQMGDSAFELWKRGRVELRDFVQPYNDRVFGDMVREASVKGMLGRSGNNGSGSNRTPETIETLNGIVPKDIGKPGNSPETLDQFLKQSDGQLARFLRDPNNNLVEDDWGLDMFVVNSGGVRSAARNFVAESQNIQYGRDYLVQLAQGIARDNGVNVDSKRAETLMNDEYRNRAFAILEAARIGNVNLTEAQQRRLQQSVTGNYLELVYADRNERGTLTGQRRAVRSSGIEYQQRRDNFRNWVQGMDG